MLDAMVSDRREDERREETSQTRTNQLLLMTKQVSDVAKTLNPVNRSNKPSLQYSSEEEMANN